MKKGFIIDAITLRQCASSTLNHVVELTRYRLERRQAVLRSGAAAPSLDRGERGHATTESRMRAARM
jgi:hypothetical protein